MNYEDQNGLKIWKYEFHVNFAVVKARKITAKAINYTNNQSPSERTYSKTGIINSKQSNRISPKLTNMTTKIKANT